MHECQQAIELCFMMNSTSVSCLRPAVCVLNQCMYAYLHIVPSDTMQMDAHVGRQRHVASRITLNPANVPDPAQQTSGQA